MSDCARIVTDHERIDLLEARLAELEAQLPCLTGHHEPLLVVGGDGQPAPFVFRASLDGIPLLEQRYCTRCRLAYWHEIRIARLEVPG